MLGWESLPLLLDRLTESVLPLFVRLGERGGILPVSMPRGVKVGPKASFRKVPPLRDPGRHVAKSARASCGEQGGGKESYR